MLKELKYKNIQELIGAKLNDKELNILEEIKKQKSVMVNNAKKPVFQKTLKEHFENSNRNEAIKSVLKDGYTQAKIAHYLGVSRSLICKIVKQMNK